MPITLPACFLCRRPALGAAFGMALFAVAFLLRWWGASLMPGLPFVTFFLAVMITAVVAGWKPAVLVAAVSLVAAWYFFLNPEQSFALRWPDGPVALCFFLLVASTQVATVALLQRATAQLGRERAQVLLLLTQQRALYHELQHRVANGIQSAASLLRLQAARIQDATDAEGALHDAAERLGSVAAVHRRLYDPDLAAGGLQQAVTALAQDVLAGAGLAHVSVAARIDAPVAGQHEAMLLAKIIAEATTNAAKHAFPGRCRGSLRIALAPAGAGRELRIEDDGAGLAGPPRANLGVAVMQGLAAQLGGSWRMEQGHEGGARVIVALPPAVALSAD
jgi:two-component sensor histidine kinase